MDYKINVARLIVRIADDVISHNLVHIASVGTFTTICGLG